MTTSGGRAQVLVHYADGDWESMCVACRAAFDAAAEAGDDGVFCTDCARADAEAIAERELKKRRRSRGGMFEWHT